MTERLCSILPSRRTAELGLRVELWPYLANGADVFVSLYWVNTPDALKWARVQTSSVRERCEPHPRFPTISPTMV